ncbi:hypothetical protein ACFX13_029895 [Malus domestica]
MMFPGRGQMIPIMNAFDLPAKRARSRRNGGMVAIHAAAKLPGLPTKIGLKPHSARACLKTCLTGSRLTDLHGGKSGQQASLRHQNRRHQDVAEQHIDEAPH